MARTTQGPWVSGMARNCGLAMTSGRLLAPRMASVLLVALVSPAVAAGCGGGAPTRIPKPTAAHATPLPTPVQLAPGVAVSPRQLTIPPYTISGAHPPPAGTPVRTVMLNLVEDNYIENIAIERANKSLLKFADAGALLSAEAATIASNQSKGIHVTSIVDHIASATVGSQQDPGLPGTTLAVILSGTEIAVHKVGAAAPVQQSLTFNVIVWLHESSGKYLLVDLARA